MDRRVRASREFMLTVPVPEVSESVRVSIVDTVAVEELSAYVCAIEEYPSKPGKYHCHMYFKTVEKVFMSDLLEYLHGCFPDVESLNLIKVKSSRNCIKYVSKEDLHLIYENVSVSQMHINFRIFEWARSTPVFRCNDRFVIEHRNCYRFLERAHADIRAEMLPVFRGFLRYMFCPQVDWAVACTCWWNKRIAGSGVRRQQLYLWGSSGVGKSTYIERLIGKRNMVYVFMPDVGKFAFQSFDERIHKLILFEEFDLKFHCVSMLKRLLESRPFVAPVKCGAGKMITFTGPVIFVSNYCEIEDDALKNRLLVVEARESVVNVQYGPVPKDEGQEEVSEEGTSAEGEAISISSSEDDAEGEDTVS